MNTTSSTSSLRARQRSGAYTKRWLSVTLSACLLLGSLMLAYTLLNPGKSAYATGLSEYPTQSDPWGIALDTHGHIFVAEPGCDVPNCLTAFAASISEYNVANGTKVATFAEPVGYSSPAFLAIDGSGNIWFTEPNSNAIGKLVPVGSGTWTQNVVPTASSAPFDITLDNNGNLWFTEYSSGKIGFVNPTVGLLSIVETATPAGATSNPYGITKASDGTIWFTENALNNSTASGIIGSFTPTANGTLALNAITEHTVTGVPHPHLITTDVQGNVWYSGGFAGVIGRFKSAVNTVFDVALNACPPGAPLGCGVHISGIGVDSKGQVWFDDSLSQRVGYLDPTTTHFTTITLATPNAHPHDGLLVDASDNVWFTEEYAYKLGVLPGGVLPPAPTPTVTVTPTPPPSTTTPVSKTWYFAEGRVGKGFREYLTLGNPDASIDCDVNVQYLYTFDNSNALKTATVPVTVAHQFRVTRSVNNDINIVSTSNTAAIVSAIVTVDNVRTPNCKGIVAERPMYFRTNINSGSDVLGATSLSKNYLFADVQTRSGSSSSIASYFTILNPPGNASATVVATYYAGGHAVGSQTVHVPGGARGTIASNAIALPAHVVAVVTSNQPVAVERPVYYRSIPQGNAGTVSSAATVIGAQTAKNDWLFAEGYTGGKFQEYLMLANLNGTPLSATVKLEYKGGHWQSVTYQVGAMNQVAIDVNQLNAHPSGQCDSNPCHVSPETSVEVTSASALVAERELFFQYSHTVNGLSLGATGGTDVIGQAGPASYAAYTFAEGYTNKGYNEWLTLQNPTGNMESVTLTLSNSYGRSFSQTISIAPTSRTTTDITQLVAQHLVHPGDDYRDYEVTMSLSASGSAVFVAERPMYWNTSGSSFVTQGGSDIIGYVGN